MEDDITKFGRSSAAMKSQFISKLRETFALNRTDETKPSNLNSGIIGMMMDVYANAVEDGYFNSNTRSKEMFVSSAKFDDSLYLHASACKINSFFATPAAVDMLIALPVKDIINRSVEKSGYGYKMLVLNEKTKFLLDRYYYTLDYPVDIIVKTSSTGKNVISCKYDLSKKNEFSDVNSTYITGVTQTINGVEYYVFKVRLHQLDLVENEFIYTPSSNTSGIYTIPYQSQLAGFKVLYKDAADDEWDELDKVYYGVLSTSSQKFHYYRLRDNTVSIEFSVDPKHWKPSLNGRIKIELYLTEGSNGNFDYTSEEVIPYLQQDDTDVYQAAMSGLILNCELATTTSSGGSNMPTIDDIRNMIIDHKASRSTIISDKDLTRVIENLGMSTVKQRDDIYDRRFMTYALIQNSENGFILPGRTGELYIPEAETINQSEVNGRLVDPNNVYQFWLADDDESYNTTRFIAKQPEEIKTSVTVKTNYFKMSVANSHNIELAQNNTEKCRLITFNAQTISFENSDDVIVFSGNVITAHFNNGVFAGQTVNVRTMTESSVAITYNDSSSTQIVKNHEYLFTWDNSEWTVSDLGEVGSDPLDDGLLPNVDTVNIPKGLVVGTEFIFKNHCMDNVNLIYYDYSTSIPEKRTFILKPNFMIKFAWSNNWVITELGAEGSIKTPTNCLIDEDWDTLYSFYEKYNKVLMMCPYIIKIFKNPYFVSLYDVFNESYIKTIFAYNDYNSSEKFAINGVNVIRSDVRDKQYKVYCDVSVSDSMYEKFMTLDINEFPMKLKIELFKDEQSYAYFELNTVEDIPGVKNKLRFSTFLDTDNVLHDDDMIRIINRKYSGNDESTNVIPTNDPIYTDSGVTPNTYFIPFKTKLKVYILNVPDVSFDSYYASHIIDDDEREAGFIVTDAFETDDLAYFVRDMSDIFSTTLEVVKVNGKLPKYPADVPMKYTEIIYDRNSDGSLKTDNDGNFIILHDIGDPVLDADGNQMYSHRAGEDLLTYDVNGNLIYDKEPEITYIIKNIPLISMMTMLDYTTKSLTYSALQNIASTLKGKILPRLVENNSITVGLYNTMGPSNRFVQGSKNSFNSLNNLSVSIELSVKFNSSVSDTEPVVDSIKLSIEDYMRSIIERGYFYATDLISYLKDMYSDIDYIEFVNINGLDSSIQTIKTSETIEDKTTPEYITIAQTLSETDFKLDGTVKFTPNIVVNTII